jgi:cytochrome c peroxidase
MPRIPVLVSLGTAVAVLGSCAAAGSPVSAPTRIRDAAVKDLPDSEELVAARTRFERALGRALPAHFPTPREPATNPTTREKVELGRRLFYDVRLSGNATQACASCHVQALAFTDGRAQAVGSTGEQHPRNSMSLTNAAFNSTFNWANPNLTEIEQQVRLPLAGTKPVEMGIAGRENEILGRVRADAAYPALFAAAFADDRDPISWRNIERGLGAFTRAMVSTDSAYDRYVAGDATALSAAALRGKALFESEPLGCANCHNGFNFSTGSVWRGSPNARPFFNTGLYNTGATGYPVQNAGLAEYTGVISDTGRMRPPTLRNLRYSAPYGHDGSVPTLTDVIRNYARGGRVIETGPLAGDGRRNLNRSALVTGFAIDETGIADLLAFLDTLNDAGFVSNPDLKDPFGK